MPPERIGRFGRVAFIVFLAGCSPDLHEAVGPLKPFPNVTGRVVRDGVPVYNIKVGLEDTVADTTYEDDWTDSAGDFEFSEIGAGKWTVRVDGADSTDFDRVTYEFEFTSADTSIEVPVLDISLGGLSLRLPADNDTLEVPTLGSPLVFEWTWPDDDPPRFEIRFYVVGGPAYWISRETRETSLVWNGVGNQESSLNQPVGPGDYRWHLRVDGEYTLEYRTVDRFLTLE